MLTSIFGLFFIVAMCLVAGFLIWGQIRNFSNEREEMDARLDAHTAMR